MTNGLGRVVVTGANGHLGRRLIRRLVRDGSVRAVVRSERAARTVHEVLGEDRKAEGRAASPREGNPRGRRAQSDQVEILDYRDVDALARAAEGCRFAVHLPGVIKETRSNKYEDAHEATCRALAQAAGRAGIERVVYLSILGSDPGSPNPCLASKGRAERILLEAKTPAVILKLPLVLGPGDDTSRVVRAEALARFVPLIGSGRTHAQPIFADDVIDAILACMRRPGLEDRSFDLAGPESLPQREFIARAARLYDRSSRVVPLPVGLVRLLAFTAEKLMAEPPMTRDMLGVLLHDDRVDPEPVCKELGIELTPLDETLRRSVGPETGE